MDTLNQCSSRTISIKIFLYSSPSINQTNNSANLLCSGSKMEIIGINDSKKAGKRVENCKYSKSIAHELLYSMGPICRYISTLITRSYICRSLRSNIRVYKKFP